MDKKSLALSHSIPGKGTLKDSKFVRKNVNNFLDGEEFAVSQPIRCDNCVHCKYSFVRQLEMCQKDKRELEIINSDLTLNLNERSGMKVKTISAIMVSLSLDLGLLCCGLLATHP